MFINQANIHFI